MDVRAIFGDSMLRTEIDGIGATILYSQRTCTEIRRQTKNTALFHGTGNCPREVTEGDEYQIASRKRYHWDVECPHFESMRKTERIDVRAGQVQIGHQRTVRDTL